MVRKLSCAIVSTCSYTDLSTEHVLVQFLPAWLTLIWLKRVQFLIQMNMQHFWFKQTVCLCMMNTFVSLSLECLTLDGKQLMHLNVCLYICHISPCVCCCYLLCHRNNSHISTCVVQYDYKFVPNIYVFIKIRIVCSGGQAAASSRGRIHRLPHQDRSHACPGCDSAIFLFSQHQHRRRQWRAAAADALRQRPGTASHLWRARSPAPWQTQHWVTWLW